MVIEEKKYVEVSYDLYVDGEDGLELWEQAPKSSPLKFIFGLDDTLEKFNENLKGLKKGDKFDFRIACEDAYGPYDEEKVVDLDKELFMKDGELAEEVEEDSVIELTDESGNSVNGIVLEISDVVTVDLNHLLAGEDLTFRGEVLEVRNATKKEMAAAR